MGAFSERLRVAIGGRSVLAFSKLCGISDSLIRKYLADSLPGMDNLVLMARAAEVNIAWLAAGEGAMRSGQFQAEDGDCIRIPFYGDALCPVGDTQPEGYLSFARLLLPERDLEVARLLAVRVLGDAMAPLLNEGDTLLVDNQYQSLEGDGLYLIHTDGRCYPKRLQRQFDGGIQVINQNKAYQDSFVPKQRIDELQILGRIVWAGGWMG